MDFILGHTLKLATLTLLLHAAAQPSALDLLSHMSDKCYVLM